MAEVGEKDPYEKSFIQSKTNDKFASDMVKDINSSNYGKDELDNFKREATQLFNEGVITKRQFDDILYSINKNMDKIPKVSHGRSRSPVRPPALGPRGRRPSGRRRSSGSPTAERLNPRGGTRRMRKSKKHTHKKHKSRRHKKSKKHRK
jgi:hypothetical protein